MPLRADCEPMLVKGRCQKPHLDNQQVAWKISGDFRMTAASVAETSSMVSDLFFRHSSLLSFKSPTLYFGNLRRASAFSGRGASQHVSFNTTYCCPLPNRNSCPSNPSRSRCRQAAQTPVCLNARPWSAPPLAIPRARPHRPWNATARRVRFLPRPFEPRRNAGLAKIFCARTSAATCDEELGTSTLSARNKQYLTVPKKDDKMNIANCTTSPPPEPTTNSCRAQELPAAVRDQARPRPAPHAPTGRRRTSRASYASKRRTMRRILANIGSVYVEQDIMRRPTCCSRRAVELDPENVSALSMLVYARQHRCAWTASTACSTRWPAYSMTIALPDAGSARLFRCWRCRCCLATCAKPRCAGRVAPGLRGSPSPLQCCAWGRATGRDIGFVSSICVLIRCSCRRL